MTRKSRTPAQKLAWELKQQNPGMRYAECLREARRQLGIPPGGDLGVHGFEPTEIYLDEGVDPYTRINIVHDPLPGHEFTLTPLFQEPVFQETHDAERPEEY